MLPKYGSGEKRIKIRELCHIGIFVALIAVCAQIAIPLPGGVPITLQAWAISLAGLVLGAKNGAMAALVYVLLGAAGAPVFAGFSGGFGVILRHTGGFILSFPALAFLAGVGAKRARIFSATPGLSAGIIVNWVAGLLWFSWITGHNLGVSFGYAIAPFIFAGVLKAVILPALGKKIFILIFSKNY